MAEREITERQFTVRQAISALYKVGLRIGSLECHPETMADICAEGCTLVDVIQAPVTEATALAFSHFPVTYCGIPLKQVVLSENGKA